MSQGGTNVNPRTVRRRHPLFAWTVFVAGCAVLVSLNGGLRGIEATLDSGAYVVLWGAMILVAALSPLPLPWGRATATLTTALDLAALLLFGPAVAVWVGVLSRLVAGATQRWSPLRAHLLGFGQIVLALAAAGMAYASLGGDYGEALAVSGAQVVALLGAFAAYLGVKGLVGAVGDALAVADRSGRAFADWFAEHLPGDLILLPVAPLLALTQVRIGPVGVALFLLPLLVARYVFNLWAQTRTAHLGMVRMLMSAVDAADPFTRDHSYRISRMCLCVGRHLGLKPAALEELEYAALLHDLGRTAIQRDIRTKRGRLNEQEMNVLKAHPQIAADLIAGQRFFPRAAEIVLAHHEQPDGGGYPRGLAGEAVPPGSRIIMVVAAFDAMTSDRPYRRGLSPEEAFEELLAHSGTQFDPEVVEALVQLYASGTLFAAFDAPHLERYRDGHEHSLAVEAHLRTHGGGGSVPEKAGRDRPAARARGVDTLPILELPGATPAETTTPSGTAPIPMPVPLPARVEKSIALPAKGAWRLVVAGRSDPGCQRTNNEDCFGVFESHDAARGALLVLADGMGGAAAGEVASRIAVDTVRDSWGLGKKARPPKDALLHALTAANQAVHGRASEDSRLGGMGATCTAAVVAGLDLTLGHVGDSRAYLLRKGAIEQLTQDHTFVEEMARVAGDRGVPVPAVSSQALTRCIGAAAEIVVDVSPKPIRLEEGTTIVLCSDGLTKVVEDDEILDLAGRGDTPAAACEALIDLARARGGPDNVTVIIGRVTKD